MHLHGGCWVAPAAQHPPRLLVAFPKEFEGADIVRAGGSFAVSLMAEDQGDLNGALFAGRHSLDALGRERFLQAPSGCPVLADGVGYFDCRLAEAVDFGDFLLAVGDVQAAALLHPDKTNLTVNEIQRRAPGQPGPVRLPLRGFDDAGPVLARAPVQGADAATLDAVYAGRRWGLFLIAARSGAVEHLHVGGWAIQCSHLPPRMLVCVDRRLPAVDLIRASGRFALSLLAEDQLPLALALHTGNAGPAALAGALFLRAGLDPPVLEDAVAHFVCQVEGEFDTAGDHAGFHGPVTRFAWGRRHAPQLRADQLTAGTSPLDPGARET